MNSELRETERLSIKEHSYLLLKRCIALPSKMIGFKPFCLYLGTWLLIEGKISEWVWFCVLIVVLFGIVGLKVFTQLKGGTAITSSDETTTEIGG
jgi:hypothetical protein